MLAGNDCIYYDYDNTGRATGEVWKSSGGSTIYAFAWDYDAVGNRIYEYKQTSPAVETYYAYNLLNRPLHKHVMPADTYIYYQYDDRWNIVRVDEPTESTYFEYDAASRVTRVGYKHPTLSSYVAETFGYDALGRRTEYTPLGNAWHFAYDEGGNMISRESSTQHMPRGKAGQSHPWDNFHGNLHNAVKNHLGQTEKVLGGAGTVTFLSNSMGGFINENVPMSSLPVNQCRYTNAITPEMRKDIKIDVTSWLTDDSIPLQYPPEYPLPLNVGHEPTIQIECRGRYAYIILPQPLDTREAEVQIDDNTPFKPVDSTFKLGATSQLIKEIQIDQNWLDRDEGKIIIWKYRGNERINRHKLYSIKYSRHLRGTRKVNMLAGAIEREGIYLNIIISTKTYINWEELFYSVPYKGTSRRVSSIQVTLPKQLFSENEDESSVDSKVHVDGFKNKVPPKPPNMRNATLDMSDQRPPKEVQNEQTQHLFPEKGAYLYIDTDEAKFTIDFSNTKINGELVSPISGLTMLLSGGLWYVVTIPSSKKQTY